MTQPQCKLAGIVAKQAQKAVLLRRGPSRWVQLINWDLSTDTFEFGQWMKATVKISEMDLSPSGSLLIYYATKYERFQQQSEENPYSWYVLSKPPYFTALTLWIVHGDFPVMQFSSESQLVCTNRSSLRSHPRFTLPESLTVVETQQKNHFLTNHGWKNLQMNDVVYQNGAFITKSPEVWYKDVDEQRRLVLTRWRDNKGYNFTEAYSIETGVKATPLQVDWADVDVQSKRVLFTEQGQIGFVNRDEIVAITDVSDMRPTNLRAP